MAKKATKSPRSPSKGRSKRGPSEFNTENAAEFSRELPVALSPEVIEKKNNALVKAEVHLEKAVGEKKDVVAGCNVEIKEIKEKISTLVAQLDTKTEGKPVKCFTRSDFTKNLVEVVRTDNGEVVESRTMTSDDRQEDAFN